MSNRISDFESLAAAIRPDLCVVVLYSGGLDGTYLLHRLAEWPSLHTVALTVDLGGGVDEHRIRDTCSRLGAESLFVNRVDEFGEYVADAIAAQATYLGGHPLSASLTRPLIAEVGCMVAEQRGADMILHTAQRSQNSLRRFDGAITALGFAGTFGSPFADHSISRSAKAAELGGLFLAKPQVVVGPSQVPFSTDVNLWCREFEGEWLDDPEDGQLPEEVFEWTRLTRSGSTTVDVEFERGRPVAVNGERRPLVDLVAALNGVVGSHGIGRHIGLEELESGWKVQEVREMPAATLLLDAYRRLENACLPSEFIRIKQQLEQVWVREAVEGRWFGPLREACHQFISSAAMTVTGSLTYTVSPWHLQPTSVRAEHRRYLRSRAEIDLPSGRRASADGRGGDQ